ncbi:Flagellar hook-basal body complex protein FliE [Dickeya dianthicola]|uniref:Flagellar hook-basal body complex protein FliE n=1 Tax=Dickeya dianthicola TaxID=204039 RepID=A0AAP6S107_9GAMM|nr:flagellar hook-basal body complex protein FliE [Dickeya dianthicola]ATO33718.1 Flagellar hook-basal body complex protein FliE [Dickeya dianthicola RNS04.9]AYC19589.1 Flagellar hook-basal body complex protein FliE [Dickeya dianthicola]MBI0437693.1 flagellar hook-basal body complex protein FliE [Dickeya dianthicola]MBI0447895.1 flagellar hook-basal body complex protein FliE [Dickeya dianthicola]MBI0452512.1 flagellar hook-basal body complex protein FliE [Dickeya dianthicola]
MSIQGIDAVLQQMQITATKAAGGADSNVASQSGFASELKAALEKINETRTQAQTQAEAFTLGKPGVALNDVMVDNQKASIALQMGVQVRNKLVSAYQEVMNMTI